MTSNYINAAFCQPTTHTPIWMMRQAGRYMSDFRKLRSRYSFLDIVHTPELAMEVTLQPIKTFNFDAAILFSDILVIAEALGSGLEYQDQKGPNIPRRILTHQDVTKLQPDRVKERLQYVCEAIKLIKKALPKETPLIGFAGAPFTVASYMIGDSEKHDMKKFLMHYFRKPKHVESVLEIITSATVTYLNAQIEAGVDAIQIFDSWANELPWDLARRLSTGYIEKIIKQLNIGTTIPVTVFSTANSVFYPLMAQTGAQVIGFDSKANLADIQPSLFPHKAMQGNLDPNFLFAPSDVLRREVHRILDSLPHKKGFIFNLGHGVKPETPEDNVKLLVDLVHEHKP